MNDKFKYQLNRFLPKYSELDAFILLLLVSMLFLFSDIFRNWFLNNYLTRLNLDGHIANFLFFISLGIGTYYTFHFRKKIPDKSRHLVIGMIALVMSILNIIVGTIIIMENMSLDTNIFSIIANLFIAFNIMRGLTTYILIRTYDKPEELLYQPFNVRSWHIILITIVVPVALYLSLASTKNIHEIFILLINLYGFSSMAIYILDNFQFTRKFK